MFYSFSLPIPANTPESVPTELECNLTWGVITKVVVRFPPGCAGLAKVKILHRRHQVWPTNIGDWFYGDAEEIPWQEHYELLEMPAIFTLLGYNDDDTWEHTPIIRFEILHPLIALANLGLGLQYPTATRLLWSEL